MNPSFQKSTHSTKPDSEYVNWKKILFFYLRVPYSILHDSIAVQISRNSVFWAMADPKIGKNVKRLNFLQNWAEKKKKPINLENFSSFLPHKCEISGCLKYGWEKLVDWKNFKSPPSPWFPRSTTDFGAGKIRIFPYGTKFVKKELIFSFIDLLTFLFFCSTSTGTSNYKIIIHFFRTFFAISDDFFDFWPPFSGRKNVLIFSSLELKNQYFFGFASKSVPKSIHFSSK